MRAITSVFAGLALATAGSAQAALDTVFATSFESAWVAGYHVGYQRTMYPTAVIDFAALSHIVIGPLLPNPNGSVNTSFDIDPVNGPPWAQGVATAAHAQGAKATLMVGGAGQRNNFAAAASAANRAAFVNNLLATMDALGCDGLDLDWEPLDPVDHAAFQALAQALRNARPTMILTVPLIWINANFASPTDPWFGQIAPLFDQLNVMTYDMAGAWQGWQSWHNAALYGASGTTPSSADTSVDYYLRAGVPRHRLGIGIPFYGTCWNGVTAPLQSGGTVLGSDNDFGYRTIINGYYSAANAHFDANAQVPWLGSASPLGAQPCNFITYDDEASIAAKGAYALRHGLGGTIIWTIGQGYVPERPLGQRDPLLEAIRGAFHPLH